MWSGIPGEFDRRQEQLTVPIHDNPNIALGFVPVLLPAKQITANRQQLRKAGELHPQSPEYCIHTVNASTLLRVP